MPPPGLIIVKIQSNCLAFFTGGLREHYITFKSTQKKKKRKGSAFPLPSSKKIYFCSIV
jgi:hypothetical protein